MRVAVVRALETAPYVRQHGEQVWDDVVAGEAAVVFTNGIDSLVIDGSRDDLAVLLRQALRQLD